MRRLPVLILLAALLPAPVRAADAPAAKPVRRDPAPLLTIPDAVKGEVGDFLEIPATTVGKSVVWVVLTPGLKLFPINLLKDSKTAVVYSAAPGVYRVLAYTASPDGDPSPPSYCTVTIGTPPPPPGPTPPPTPPDPLTAALQKAYTAEADPTKVTEVPLLASVYKQAAATTVNDASITTMGALLNVLQKAAASLIDAKAIPTVRRAIADYLDGQLGTLANAPLDAAARQKAGAAFSALATALGNLK